MTAIRHSIILKLRLEVSKGRGTQACRWEAVSPTRMAMALLFHPVSH